MNRRMTVEYLGMQFSDEHTYARRDQLHHGLSAQVRNFIMAADGEYNVFVTLSKPEPVKPAGGAQ